MHLTGYKTIDLYIKMVRNGVPKPYCVWQHKLCDFIEKSNNGIGDPWDIRYIAGVNLIEVMEGAEELPEFEVLDVEKDGEKHEHDD